MSRWRRLRRLLLPWRGREWLEERIDLEFAHHLEARTEELVRRGHPPDEARRLAGRAFGDAEAYRDRCLAESRALSRSVAWTGWIEALAGDLRYTLRGLAHSPRFTLAIVLTLALGIGANAAIFTVLDAVLLRPIPYPRPDELYELRTFYPERSVSGVYISSGMGAAWLDAPDLGARVQLHRRMDVLQTGGGEPRTLTVEALSPGLTDALGVAPLLGRTFSEADAGPGDSPVALVGYGFWRRELGGDPDVVGHTITLDGRAVTVAGVMPPKFRFPHNTSTPLWLPLASDGTALGRPPNMFEALVRVPPGQYDAFVARAEAFAAAQQAVPGSEDVGVPSLTPMNRPRAGKDTQRVLWIVFGAVGGLFLIALLNGVNLMLARGSSRESEVGVRIALGASRGRLARQLLLESFVLALLGATAAAALARLGVDGLLALAPRDLTYWAPRSIELGGRVLAFTFGLAVLAGLAFGLVPAIWALRRRPERSCLPASHTVAGDREGHRLRGVLVAVQVATSLIVLFGAGLLGRSFWRTVRVDPGFEPAGLVVLGLHLSESRYPSPEARIAQAERIRERLASIAGVTDVSRSCCAPPQSGITFGDGLYVRARDEPAIAGDVVISFADADAGYRRVLGIQLLRGRDPIPSEADEPVESEVLVTRALAERLDPGGDALGIALHLGEDGRDERVVGVVENVKLNGLTAPWGDEGIIRTSRAGSLWAGGIATFALRTNGDEDAVIRAARRTVLQIDAEQPIDRLQSMSDALWESTLQARFYLVLMAVFAAVALLLAAGGLYALLAFHVRRRIRELGVRMAVGATRARVVRLVVGRGLRLAALGIVLGGAFSMYASRALGDLLFETSPRDAVTLTAVAAIVLVVALAASYFPAHRASLTDPARVLRHE